MKTTKMLLVALAALGMAACSNNDEIPGMNNDGTKSVAIRFEGLSASTKAVGDPQTATAISLANMTVYFTDGTNILKKEKFTSSSSEWAKLTTTGHVFHQLPSAVTNVHIVGNSEGRTFTETNLTALKASVVKAAGEQIVTNVTLFGESGLTAADPEEGDEHVDNLYKATVNLKPLVARFEVGNIACTDVPTGKIKKYSLDVIGLINFNSGINLAGTSASGSYTLDNILAPGTTPAVQGKYIFGETSDSENSDYSEVSWAWNKITDATNIITGGDYNPNTNQKFVYQFIPDKVGTADVTSALMPQIKLVLKNIEWADGSANPFNSVVTASFKVGQTPLTDFEAGKIYTVDYRFESGNVGPWNPDDVKCVQIDVKVAEWQVVALTPVFE